MLKNAISTKGYLAVALTWAAVLSGHITALYHTEMLVYGNSWEIYARFLVMTWIIGILAFLAWLKWVGEIYYS